MPDPVKGAGQTLWPMICYFDIHDKSSVQSTGICSENKCLLKKWRRRKNRQSDNKINLWIYHKTQQQSNSIKIEKQFPNNKEIPENIT